MCVYAYIGIIGDIIRMHSLTRVFLKIIKLNIKTKEDIKTRYSKEITLQQKQTWWGEQNKLKLSLAYFSKRHGPIHKVNHYYYLSQGKFRIILLQRMQTCRFEAISLLFVPLLSESIFHKHFHIKPFKQNSCKLRYLLLLFSGQRQGKASTTCR